MDKNQTMDQIPDEELKFVHQFLIEHNFENTADALMIEATIKGFSNFQKDVKTEDEIFKNYQEQVMLTYKSGDWRTFFQLWTLLISEDAKETKAYKILMLYLYVYFAMLPKHLLQLHWNKQKENTQLDNGDSIVLMNQSDIEYDENFMTDMKKNMSECMEELRKFLNTTGKELENDVELRPYFALPFIEDPYTEPFLSKIFEKPWTDELTENLQVFLNKYKALSFSSVKYNDANSNKLSSNYSSLSEEPKQDIVTKKPAKNNVPIIPNDRNIPIFLENDSKEGLCNLYDIKYNQKSKSIQTVSINSSEEEIYSSHMIKKNKKFIQCSQELAVTKSRLCEVHANYEKLKRRFHKLHADYHKLMSIARVLTTALENSVKGEVVDFQTMLETCIKIFPDLFNQNIRDSSHCSSELLLDKSLSSLKVVDSTVYSSTVPPKLLDFKKIKIHLINGSIKTKLFLLQALRRKITFSQVGERDETVHEYISKDLLGLHSQIASYKGKSILPYLLTSQNISIPHPLQQSITRLLNALASFRSGRDYLSVDSTVVDMVFQCLTSDSDNNIDTLTCNMMIAMLQKLSLRKQQRIYMIENGLVEWLIHHLHDQYNIMDSYRLEYATALLMNLSLHQTTQRRVSGMASLLISTLTELLLMDHTSILPYINGALNNFLANRAINEEAKKSNFASVLEQYSKYKNGEIRKHLEHILQIHRGEIMVKTDGEEIVDNDNEEYDVLESQLEENDPVKNNYGELSGESLLDTCYRILPKGMQKEEIILDVSSSEQFKIDDVDFAVHNNQIKSMHSTQEKILYEENLLRKSAVQKRDIRGKDSNVVLERPETLPREENLSRKLLNKKDNIKNTENNVVLQRFETVSHEKSFSRRLANRKQDVKNRNNSIVLENSIQKIAVQQKLQAHSTKFKSTPIKERPLYRQQSTNERWNVNSTRFTLKDIYDESATYIYENQTSKGSSKTTIPSSTLLAIGSEAESTVMEKLSSIASLNIKKSRRLENINSSSIQETEDSEDAFLAKPKLPRTPP